MAVQAFGALKGCLVKNRSADTKWIAFWFKYVPNIAWGHTYASKWPLSSIWISSITWRPVFFANSDFCYQGAGILSMTTQEHSQRLLLTQR